MTIVLACLTQDAVFQVSDRRLTSTQGPLTVIDDESNKAVLFNGRLAFGYTGLSQFAGERTDLWLAKTLSEAPNTDVAAAADLLRERASEFVARSQLPQELRWHAFQGAGWLRLKGETELTPGIITVHNYLRHGSELLLPRPLDRFDVVLTAPSTMPRGYFLQSIGLTPTDQERRAIARLVRRCIKHRQAGHLAVLHALFLGVRWLSRLYTRIGPSLMGVCIPRTGVEMAERTGQVLALLAPAGGDLPTCQYVTATGQKQLYAPNCVIGKSVLSDIVAGYL